MTERAPDRIWSGIDIAKTLAGVLAAVSAAVVGSYLGVAGTLAGAAVASLIGSVGTEVYHRTITRGKQKLQGTFTMAPAAVGTPPVPAAEQQLEEEPTPPRRIRWKRVALVAAAIFVVAMGTLTVAEVLSGRSIADATRGGSGDRSTISSIFRGRTDRSDKAPVPQVSTTPKQSVSTAPTPAPSTQPTASTTPATDTTSTAPPTQQPTGTGQTPTDGDQNRAPDPNDGTGNDR